MSYLKSFQTFCSVGLPEMRGNHVFFTSTSSLYSLTLPLTSVIDVVLLLLVLALVLGDDLPEKGSTIPQPHIWEIKFGYVHSHQRSSDI